MRKLILSGAIAVLVLAMSSMALASLTQTSTITLTASKARQSTGVRMAIESTETTGAMPAAVTKIVVRLPKGTRFNLRTPRLTRCTVPDKQLKDQFGRKCPSGSLIASGTGRLNVFPLPSGLEKTPYEVPTTLTAYLDAKGLIVVVRPTITAYKSMITVLHAKVSGSTVTVKLPKLMWGADKKTKPPFPGVQVVLFALKLNVPAIGSGRRALITAGQCVSRRFVVRSQFSYADGSRVTRTSSSACR